MPPPPPNREASPPIAPPSPDASEPALTDPPTAMVVRAIVSDQTDPRDPASSSTSASADTAAMAATADSAATAPSRAFSRTDRLHRHGTAWGRGIRTGPRTGSGARPRTGAGPGRETGRGGSHTGRLRFTRSLAGRHAAPKRGSSRRRVPWDPHTVAVADTTFPRGSGRFLRADGTTTQVTRRTRPRSRPDSQEVPRTAQAPGSADAVSPPEWLDVRSANRSVGGRGLRRLRLRGHGRRRDPERAAGRHGGPAAGCRRGS